MACLTGLEPGIICRACSVSSLDTPVMSDGWHAKISRFSRRNSTSADEVLTRQCPCLRDSIYGAHCGIRRTRRRSINDEEYTNFTQVRPPGG
jgi:hypothetical protein